MFEQLDVFAMAKSLAGYAGARQSVIARNIAQADTPGYKQQDLTPFSELYSSRSEPALRATRAGHLAAPAEDRALGAHVVRGADASPDGNTVTLEDEIMKSAVVRQQHDMALTVYRHGLDVLRASLGRR